MLTHLDAQNRPQMVDVGGKAVTRRTAHAMAVVELPAALAALLQGDEIMTKKGPIFQTAILAGVMGAKQTSSLIPLCHPLPLHHVDLQFTITADAVEIRAVTETHGKTGVEMEALTAVSIAALAIYDMCKAVDKGMVVEGIHVVEKTKQ